MNPWAAFALGLVIGAGIGGFTIALLAAAGEQDQRLERLRDPERGA